MLSVFLKEVFLVKPTEEKKWEGVVMVKREYRKEWNKQEGECEIK